MILCVGEILADMIGCENNGSVRYERKAGGAPFNVACAIKKFGGHSAFVGAVGDDIIGAFLEKFAAERGLDELVIAKHHDRNTTLAFVDIDANGERSFCFNRKNTADYALPDISDGLIARSDIVHVGSLMLSEHMGRESALDIMTRARAAGKTVSFDVNFRTDIFRDTDTAVAIYKRYIELADIVKLSEDEADIFGEKYVSGLNALVCITLGGKGSKWIYGGESGCVPSIKVKPVDTTGAGDAFYAGLLKELDGVGKAGYTRDKLNDALAYANVCGALNTLGRGAIDALPDKDKIDSMVGRK